MLDGSRDFGKVEIGRSATQALTLIAGSTPLNVVGVETDSREFQGSEPCVGGHRAGESCVIEVVFTPTADGARRATLEVKTANGRVLTGQLRGIGVRSDGPHESATLTSFRDLGEATVGTHLPGTPLVLTAGSEELSSVEVESDSSEFDVEAHCPTTLAAGASCPIQVVFAPAATGTRKATLIVDTEGSQPLTSTLRGTGVLEELPKLGRFLELGDVDIGQLAVRTLTLIAGSEPLTIRGIASNSTEFRIKDHCRQTLDPRERCGIRVAFAPASPEVRTATLTVRREEGRTLTAMLRGTGVEPPKLDPSLDLGEIDLSRSSEARTLTLAAGSKNVTITGVVGTRPTEFGLTSRCPQELAAGSSCQIEVVFAPAAVGSRTASLEVTIAGRERMRARLTGTGVVPPTIRPPTLDFGRVIVETRDPETVRLTAGSKSLTVTAIGTDDPRQFIVSNPCERRLDPGESCDITVVFVPLAAESHSARLNVAFSDRPGLEVGLTGVGIEGFIRLDPARLDFGSISGSSVSKLVTLRNTGSAPLTIRSITSLSSYLTVKPACPTTLAAGGSCTFWVTFIPPQVGSYTGLITISANGAGQHSLVATGDRVPPPPPPNIR